MKYLFSPSEREPVYVRPPDVLVERGQRPAEAEQCQAGGGHVDGGALQGLGGGRRGGVGGRGRWWWRRRRVLENQKGKCGFESLDFWKRMSRIVVYTLMRQKMWLSNQDSFTRIFLSRLWQQSLSSTSSPPAGLPWWRAGTPGPAGTPGSAPGRGPGAGCSGSSSPSWPGPCLWAGRGVGRSATALRRGRSGGQRTLRGRPRLKIWRRKSRPAPARPRLSTWIERGIKSGDFNARYEGKCSVIIYRSDNTWQISTEAAPDRKTTQNQGRSLSSASKLNGFFKFY